MATITKGYTFGATETVTNAKLHTLVDSAVISDISNADVASSAAIDDSKIDFSANYVCQLTGNQTIAGVKSFSSFPITPSTAPNTDYQTGNKKYIDDQILKFVPIATMLPYGCSTAPTGWFLCDGTAYSRAVYSDLYAKIGNDCRRTGQLTTRTDDTSGVLTMDGADQGITINEKINIYWVTYEYVNYVEQETIGSLTNCTLTSVVGGTWTFKGGTGTLPTVNSEITVECYSNKFFVPDMRGRSFFGLDNLGGTSVNRLKWAVADSIGETDAGEKGGKEYHQQTHEEMFPHRHSLEGRADRTTFSSAIAISHEISGTATHAHYLWGTRSNPAYPYTPTGDCWGGWDMGYTGTDQTEGEVGGVTGKTGAAGNGADGWTQYLTNNMPPHFIGGWIIRHSLT